MYQKIAKHPRKMARTTMKHAPNVGSDRTVSHTAYSGIVLSEARILGVPERMARRAVRIITQKLGKKLPGWAQRLEHDKSQRKFVQVGA